MQFKLFLSERFRCVFVNWTRSTTLLIKKSAFVTFDCQTSTCDFSDFSDFVITPPLHADAAPSIATLISLTGDPLVRVNTWKMGQNIRVNEKWNWRKDRKMKAKVVRRKGDMKVLGIIC